MKITTVCMCCHADLQLRANDPWEGRLDDYCEECATARCDAYPGDCGKPRATRLTGRPRWLYLPDRGPAFSATEEGQP